MKRSESEVELYRKIHADSASRSHGLHPCDADEQLFLKPTLVCCGGLFTNIHNKKSVEKNVNGFIKVGLAMLGAREYSSRNDPIDVVGISYPHGEIKLATDLEGYFKAGLRGDTTTPTDFARHFAQKQLFPLVQDEKGAPRDIATMKRNLRKVHFLGASYGGVFAQQVGDVLADRLQEFGLSASDIKNVTSQAILVTAGSTTAPASGKASFTTVNVLHMHDREVEKLYDVSQMATELLAAAPTTLPLLVDAKNRPIHRDVKRTHQERMFSAREHPAKHFMVLPVSQQPSTDKKDSQPDIRPDSSSNFYMALISRPSKTNAFGDVITDNDPLNRYGTLESVRGNPVEKGSFIMPDETLHQPSSYFHYNMKDRTGSGEVHPNSMMARTLMASVLVNGMNNAIKNAQNPDKFEPLPPMKKLARLPVFTRYDIAPDVDFRSFATDGYNDAITTALTTPIQLSVRGR